MKKKNALPEQFIKALCAELKERREELGVSQDDLAMQADLHRTYVSLIERKGVNFSMLVFFRLAEALKIEPVDLMVTSQKALKKLSKSSTKHIDRDAGAYTNPRACAVLWIERLSANLRFDRELQTNGCCLSLCRLTVLWGTSTVPHIR